MVTKVSGEYVALRKHVRADADSLAFHANDKAVGRQTFIPQPYKLSDASKFIALAQKAWRNGEAYHFGIELLESGEIIGGLGIEGISLKHRNAETGYWLGKKFRRRGYMTEALTLGMRIAFKELHLKRVQAHVFTDNAASYLLLEKLGFVREGCLRKRIKQRNRWRDLYIYAILREEWG